MFQISYWISLQFIFFLFQIWEWFRCCCWFYRDFHHKILPLKSVFTNYLWPGAWRAVAVSCWCSFSIGGLHKLRFLMKALWFFHLACCWPGVSRAIAMFRWCSFYLGDIHELIIWIKDLWFFIFLVFLVIFINKFLKHRSYVVVKGFYVSVNAFESVVNSRLCYIRWGRGGRRDNIKCCNGGSRDGSRVCGGRHCKE